MKMLDRSGKRSDDYTIVIVNECDAFGPHICLQTLEETCLVRLCFTSVEVEAIAEWCRMVTSSAERN